MPRGKYDRKKAREKRNAKKEGGVPPSVPPPEISPPAPSPAPAPTVEELSKTYKLPRGVCRCGHTGDGPLSDHNDIGRGEGMGPCGSIDCDCVEFFFDHYTPFFANKGLKTEASKKAIEETVRKLTAGAVVAGKEKWAEAGETPTQAESGAVNGTQGEPATSVLSIRSPEHAAPPAIKRPWVIGDRVTSAAMKGVGYVIGINEAGNPEVQWPEHNNLRFVYGKDETVIHLLMEPVICDGTPKYEPEPQTGLCLNPLPMMNRIGAPNVTMGVPIDSLKEAIKIMREKGYKIIEPAAPRRPVYDLSFNPDHPERATMGVTLTTKERVVIDLFPPSTLEEIPEPYIFFSGFENGLSLKDAVRIARGIMKIARHGEKNGRKGKE